MVLSLPVMHNRAVQSIHARLLLMLLTLVCAAKPAVAAVCGMGIVPGPTQVASPPWV